MIAKDSIFREYDIRGLAGEDFDEQFAYRLGESFADLVHERCAGKPLRIALGRDNRLSSKTLAQKVCAGLIAGGIDVLDCALCPSPQLYHAVCAGGLDGGVQVTGSHNGPQYNGFKMLLGNQCLQAADIRELQRRIACRADSSGARPAGRLHELAGGSSAYVSALVGNIKPNMGKRRLRVVVDGGNGAGGIIGSRVLRELGCDVVELFTQPDGHFPNRSPDSSVAENLNELCCRVTAVGADLGFALDGDADRLAVVDEAGAVREADVFIFAFLETMLRQRKPLRVLADVKCSDLVFRRLPQLGAEVVMMPTGRSLLGLKLRELGGQLGVEFGGHIFFADRYFGFDDGIYAAARMVEVLSGTSRSLSAILSDLPPMASTPELRVPCARERCLQIVGELRNQFIDYPLELLDGVRIRFPRGWALVRASNTESALVMRFEAEDAEELARCRLLVESEVLRRINQ